MFCGPRMEHIRQRDVHNGGVGKELSRARGEGLEAGGCTVGGSAAKDERDSE